MVGARFPPARIGSGGLPPRLSSQVNAPPPDYCHLQIFSGFLFGHRKQKEKKNQTREKDTGKKYSKENKGESEKNKTEERKTAVGEADGLRSRIFLNLFGRSLSSSRYVGSGQTYYTSAADNL